MSAIEIVLLVLVALLYIKWIVMAISLPFMCANNKRRTSSNIIWKALCIPAWALERIMRGGWERYVIFQLSQLPSMHVRKAAYKALGAHISERVVFYKGTEIRAPHKLIIGGVV